nr:MAG TPA: hypothetical protein [Caudoviricetes sp.]
MVNHSIISRYIIHQKQPRINIGIKHLRVLFSYPFLRKAR